VEFTVLDSQFMHMNRRFLDLLDLEGNLFMESLLHQMMKTLPLHSRICWIYF